MLGDKNFSAPTVILWDHHGIYSMRFREMSYVVHDCIPASRAYIHIAWDLVTMQIQTLQALVWDKARDSACLQNLHHGCDAAGLTTTL